MLVAFYIEVVVNDQGDADISVLCDDPSQAHDAEAADALFRAAAELQQRAVAQMH